MLGCGDLGGKHRAILGCSLQFLRSRGPGRVITVQRYVHLAILLRATTTKILSASHNRLAREVIVEITGVASQPESWNVPPPPGGVHSIIIKSLWKHTMLPVARKIQVFKSVIISRLLYGLSSAWLNAAELRRLNGFYC